MFLILRDLACSLNFINNITFLFQDCNIFPVSMDTSYSLVFLYGTLFFLNSFLISTSTWFLSLYPGFPG